MTRATRAALGFTVKSGWACAVLITGSPDAPAVGDSRRIELSDPDVPEARQPYHAGFGTARGAGAALEKLVASVQRFGRDSVTRYIDERQSDGHRVRGAGVVAGSLTDPDRIANDHIRIHALEGRLFREVIVDAAAQRKLACSVWRERDLPALGGARLKLAESELRAALTALGRGIGGGWRAEHKAAALAAWLVMAGHGRA